MLEFFIFRVGVVTGHKYASVKNRVVFERPNTIFWISCWRSQHGFFFVLEVPTRFVTHQLCQLWHFVHAVIAAAAARGESAVARRIAVCAINKSCSPVAFASKYGKASVGGSYTTAATCPVLAQTCICVLHARGQERRRRIHPDAALLALEEVSRTSHAAYTARPCAFAVSDGLTLRPVSYSGQVFTGYFCEAA